MKTESEKRFLSKIIAGKVIKKYKLIGNFTNLISSYRQRKYRNSETMDFMKSKNKRCLFMEKRAGCVREFLERDENSAPGPGIKDCIRKKKIYYRKRYLQDTLDNLYRKYNQQESLKMSKTTSYRLKPFWIVQKKENQRDTCLCKVHANFDLIVKKLKAISLLKTCKKNEVVDQVLCDSSRKKLHASKMRDL